MGLNQLFITTTAKIKNGIDWGQSANFSLLFFDGCKPSHLENQKHCEQKDLETKQAARAQ